MSAGAQEGELKARQKVCRAERTVHNFLEVVHVPALFEDVVESRNLDEPADIVREKLVVDDPLRELVPFTGVAGRARA
jgi:hypothetical protein